MNAPTSDSPPAPTPPAPTPSGAPQPRRSRSFATKALVGTAALAVLWTGLVGQVLPDWLRPRIEAAATEALGTPVRLGQLKLHPWSLTVEVADASVGPAGQPWFKLQHAEAQLSLESVWRLAPVLRRVTLTRPELDLERQSADRFNISPLIDRLSQPDPQARPDEGPARFAVFNIALRDGVVRLRDRVLEQSHRVDQIELQVPFVSSLPSHIDVHVQPLLQARVNGSRLKLEGRTQPFSEGFHSELALRWQDVELVGWLQAVRPLLPPAWRPELRGGRLDTQLDIVFEQRRPPALPLLAIRGQATVSGLDLSLPAMPAAPTSSGSGRLDAAWDRLAVTGLDTQPLARQASVAQVSLEGLSLKLRPAAPVAPGAAASPASSPAAPAASNPAPWRWAVGKARLTAREIDLQTQTEAPWPRLTQWVLDVSGLDARAQAPAAAWQLSVLDEHEGRVEARGTVHPAQGAADVHLDVRQLALVPWLAPVASQLDLPLTPQRGRLSLNTHLRLDPPVPATVTGGLQVDQTVVTVSDALVSGRGADRIGFEELRLDGLEAEVGLPAPGAAATGLRRLSLGTVTLASLDAAISRDAGGRMTGQVPGRAAAAVNPPQPGADAEMPVVTLGEFLCRDCAVRFTDHAVTPSAAFRLQRTDLSVKNLSTRLDQPLGVAFQAQAQGQGKLGFKGEVRPQPLSVKGEVSVVALDLRALQPYLEPHLNVTLGAAQAQARGRVQLEDRARSGLHARYQGQLGLRDLRLRDRVNDALFLRWASLSLDGVDVAHGPTGTDADLGFIALKDFYGRVIINPDGKLNLAGIVRQQGDAPGQSITTPQASAPVAPAASAASASVASAPAEGRPDLQLRWQGIHLEKGEVDFTDTFIQPNYSARLTRIAGDISAVSSRTPEPATVEVAGAVDDGAPLRISGRLHPLGPRLYTDIQGVAKGIELTRLTPYSARYAGYAIEKGTLSVTVRYKVDGGKLDADNAVFLDQLTFGERIDSPDATSLPVQLAVSLLKNSRGEIDINLPVSGSLDDPQFSVGGIIWKVVVNLLSKAVTAPFALLTGGDNSELGSVPFEPGVGALGAASRERLDTLISKLKDRPSLKLEATGWADPDLDNEGLRQAHVERLMRRAKARATGQDLAEVSIEPAERSTWLKAAYQAADIKKPRNLIGLVQSLPDEQMSALLKASAVVNREALVDLADARADAVKAYLVERLDPERVLLTASKVAAEGQANDKSGGASVQFNLR